MILVIENIYVGSDHVCGDLQARDELWGHREVDVRCGLLSQQLVGDEDEGGSRLALARARRGMAHQRGAQRPGEGGKGAGVPCIPLEKDFSKSR